MAANRLAQAAVYIEAGQLERADELLRSALALNPLDGTALLLRARVAALSGDLAGSEAHARAATADGEVRAAAFDALAKIVGLDPARAPEALEAAGTAVRLEPDAWQHRATLALALLDARDVPNAIAQADAAVQMAPPDPAERSRGLVALARVYLADPGNRERGYRVMREAAALDPMDPGLQQQVMLAQYATGRRAEAIATAFGSLRVMPTSRVPALIARFSVYLLTRRLVWWLLLAAFAVPLVFFGIVGNLGGRTTLLESAPEVVIRVAGLVGLVAFGGVVAVVLRPLRDPSTARAVWRFAAQSALFWFAGIAIALSVLSYLLALVLGPLFFPGVPLPFLILLVTRIVHSWGALSLRVPPAAALMN